MPCLQLYFYCIFSQGLRLRAFVCFLLQWQHDKNNQTNSKSVKTDCTCFWTPLSCSTLMMSEAVRPLYWIVLSRVPTLSTLKASDQRQFPHPSMQMCSSCRMGWTHTHTNTHTNNRDRRHQTSEVSLLALYLSPSKRQVNNKILCLEDFGRGEKGDNKVPVYWCWAGLLLLEVEMEGRTQ